MSLNGVLSIGQTALAVSQAQLQVTSNNISNAADPNYTRQVANVSPNPDHQLQPGIFVGTGVNLDSITRQIDEALQGRLRASTSDSNGADTTQQWLGRVESVFNELTDQDLSTQFSTFFNSWSNLANNPQDVGLRQVVIQNGQTVADSIQGTYSQLTSLGNDVSNRLVALAGNADQLSQQIATLNGQISQAEGGGGGQANGLRDQRDALLSQLSQLMDIKTVQQDNGIVNVYVGSDPLVVNTTSRGVTTKQDTVDGQVVTKVIFKANNGEIKVSSGDIGALTTVRSKITDVIDQMHSLAGNLIFELNKVHGSGQGLEGFNQVTGTNVASDATAVLNSDTSGLKFKPTNGSFVVHVTSKATGLTTSTLVQVDLDGLNNNDTTLNTLASQLDGITGISASVNAGKLSISADSSSVEFSFSQDTSGTLASLGINNFFTGHNAGDIAISSVISGNPSMLAAAKNGEQGDNQTALAIAGLESQSVAGLNGASLKDSYQAMVNGVASDNATAKSNSDAAQNVLQTLTAQREALSGVSMDEEAVNLIKQQRAFQGAAKVITTVNELMQTMLDMVK
jgi:flagellar hook-associated protein 1